MADNCSFLMDESLFLEVSAQLYFRDTDTKMIYRARFQEELIRVQRMKENCTERLSSRPR
jgi:hypothetical protein